MLLLLLLFSVFSQDFRLEILKDMQNKKGQWAWKQWQMQITWNMSFVRSGYNFKVNVNHQSCVIIFKNAEGQIKADFSEQMWYLFF